MRINITLDTVQKPEQQIIDDFQYEVARRLQCVLLSLCLPTLSIRSQSIHPVI